LKEPFCCLHQFYNDHTSCGCRFVVVVVAAVVAVVAVVLAGGVGVVGVVARLTMKSDQTL
jgi:uncharacterized membrane protein YbhN (UPF0104 family)